MADNSQVQLGRQVYQYFLDKGLSAPQAAAIAGNMAWESGGSSGADSITAGDNRKHSSASPHSFGIGQWNDRLPGLIDYARSQGKDIPQGDLRDVNYVKSIAPQLDLNTQLGYAWNEMHGPESRAFKMIQAGDDVNSASAGAISYHRPAGWSWSNPTAGHGFSNRVSLANQIMGAGGETAPAAPSAPAIPQNAERGDFGKALSSLDSHLGEMKQKWGGPPQPQAQAPAPPQTPMEAPGAPMSASPDMLKLAALQALMPKQQPQAPAPGAGGVLSAIANPAQSQTNTGDYLQMMLNGRQKSNALAALMGQNQGTTL